MIRKTLLFIFSFFSMQFTYSQIIDRYGVNAGVSYSTFDWVHKFQLNYDIIEIKPDLDYKIGYMAFLNAEKNIKKFGLRAEMGYIQKGFRISREFNFPDGTTVIHDKEPLTLHNLALNTGIKYTPFKFVLSPYIFIGIRGDYLISYEDVELREPATGVGGGLYGQYIQDFRKLNFGGLLGVGIDIKKLLYLEVEYNPNFTKNINEQWL